MKDEIHPHCNPVDIDWQCTLLKQLSTLEFFELLKLRINIFVVEQHCPYPELDDKDRHQQTLHITGKSSGEIICCARLLAPGISYAEASIGRLAVAQAYRGQGIGSALMQHCLLQLSNVWPTQAVRISAQHYLADFYTHFGFIQTSEQYLEDNIPHIEMLRATNIDV